VNLLEHRLDADLASQVGQEQHQSDDAGEHEQEREGHRDLRDEDVLPVVAGPDRAQHRQGVGEGGQEHCQRHVDEAVLAEGAQQSW
jgi:hypothetical protein